nr:unnamed protein product [Callosobruchus chinensis]
MHILKTGVDMRKLSYADCGLDIPTCPTCIC